jgi:hypothetical protein
LQQTAHDKNRCRTPKLTVPVYEPSSSSSATV